MRQVKKLVPAYSLPGATSFNDALAAGGKLPFTPADVGPDDIAFLQYTGGTTGVSKGAMLLHRNIVANVLQVEAWLPMQEMPPPTTSCSSSPRCRSITSSRSRPASCSACAPAASAC